MKVFTIGFTKKSAREFFDKLRRPGLLRLIDVRLNNVSQLAGFSKREDLQFFCEAILTIQYLHLPELAPTQEMLDEYKKKHGAWPDYEAKFLSLMAERKVEDTVASEVIDGGCLLCSEPTPENCHRRLVAEYLGRKWGDVEIEHIL
ncbi:MAG TPA: DUF488 domain-containing protein [Candidatus Sulfotelmatobacter sp.]|jgi:uncharacterized protein (DUF488 family)|nr:DUF488 domain-containing protein [Candidatus Sulfotelmatobacter sp.]